MNEEKETQSTWDQVKYTKQQLTGRRQIILSKQREHVNEKQTSSKKQIEKLTSKKATMQRQGEERFLPNNLTQEKDKTESKIMQMKIFQWRRKGHPSMHSLVPGPNRKSTTMRFWKLSNNAGKVGSVTLGAKKLQKPQEANNCDTLM